MALLFLAVGNQLGSIAAIMKTTKLNAVLLATCRGQVYPMSKIATILGVLLLASAMVYGQPGSGVIRVYNAGAFGASQSSADNARAINACLQRACDSGYVCYVPPGQYTFKSTLNLFNMKSNSVADKCRLEGAGQGSTILWWAGTDPTKDAINMIGAFQSISDITVAAKTRWRSGIAYNGNHSIGRSTAGSLNRVSVFCMGEWSGPVANGGDGIQLGKDGYQADMLKIDHPYIVGCFSGISTWNGNVLSITIDSPTVAFNHIGVYVGTTTNLHIYDPEIDVNDINIVSEGGGSKTIIGGRTEGSKRQYFDARGSYPNPWMWQAFNVASVNASPRPTATASISAGSTIMRLSIPRSYIDGDWITVVGADVNGATLHTYIQNIGSDLVTATIYPPAGTTVSEAAVALDSGIRQAQFVESGMGPYIHSGLGFNVGTNAWFGVAQGPQLFFGNTWGDAGAYPLGSIFANTFIGAGNLQNSTTPIAQTPLIGVSGFTGTTTAGCVVVNGIITGGC